eukprot:5319549-Lingulodinium_polyedra.AAC.1
MPPSRMRDSWMPTKCGSCLLKAFWSMSILEEASIPASAPAESSLGASVRTLAVMQTTSTSPSWSASGGS